MNKLFKVIVVCCIFLTIGTAQRGQAVFAELGGNGLVFSFNYDTRFNNTPDGLGARLGLGFIGSGDAGAVLIPAQVNWLLGKNGRYFELGAGLTVVTGTGRAFDEDFSNVVGTMTFGYRRQPVDGGFMWKIAITPVIAEGIFWPYFAGLGLGYTF